MSKTAAKGKPLPPEPFDESTPPPRQRPRGTPIDRDVTLPPGEDTAGIFGQWDREGRVPPGSILCECRHLTALRDGGSPLVVIARCADALPDLSAGSTGEPNLDDYRITTWISRAPSAERSHGAAAPVRTARSYSAAAGPAHPTP